MAKALSIKVKLELSVNFEENDFDSKKEWVNFVRRIEKDIEFVADTFIDNALDDSRDMLEQRLNELTLEDFKVIHSEL